MDDLIECTDISSAPTAPSTSSQTVAVHKKHGKRVNIGAIVRAEVMRQTEDLRRMRSDFEKEMRQWRLTIGGDGVGDVEGEAGRVAAAGDGDGEEALQGDGVESATTIAGDTGDAGTADASLASTTVTPMTPTTRRRLKVVFYWLSCVTMCLSLCCVALQRTLPVVSPVSVPVPAVSPVAAAAAVLVRGATSGVTAVSRRTVAVGAPIKPTAGCSVARATVPVADNTTRTTTPSKTTTTATSSSTTSKPSTSTTTVAKATSAPKPTTARSLAHKTGAKKRESASERSLRRKRAFGARWDGLGPVPHHQLGNGGNSNGSGRGGARYRGGVLLEPHSGAPFEFRIDGLAERMAQARDGAATIFSPPFFSRGPPTVPRYKLCLRVEAPSRGAPAHLGVFFCMLRGDQDARLPWPMRLAVTVSIVDQLSRHAYTSRTFDCDSAPDDWKHVFQRPAVDHAFWFGTPQFLHFDFLFGQSTALVRNDAIVIRCSVGA